MLTPWVLAAGETDLTQYGPWGVVVAFLIGVCGKLYADNNQLHKEKDAQTTSYLVVFTQVGQALPELMSIVRDMRAERGDPLSTMALLDRLDKRVVALGEQVTTVQAQLKTLSRRRVGT